MGQQSSRSGRVSASSDIRISGETLKRTASFPSSRTGGLAAFRQRLAALSLPCPAFGCQAPRRLTTTPRKASSKIEFRSIERSVPRSEANTVNRRSFSGVKRSEHLRRSAPLLLVVFADLVRLLLALLASWLIGSALHKSLWSDPFPGRYRPKGVGGLEQMLLDTTETTHDKKQKRGNTTISAFMKCQESA